ncbi:GNAT family N-acetyltransferase [Streptomyces sp. MA5143a]|uniref:GNAT family N-acetyltransferase n=1 Tax=Streptomyces sp. MA5143a TaxID=2083010 RepID=UPI000D1B230E|nr:GNAT family N-acetyltransferase [Streptomyces sp. MA5143a]
MAIERLDDRPRLSAAVEELAELLVRTVDGGASVGFLAPLDRDAATAWWRGRVDAVLTGELAVWVARDGDGRLIGTVSLVFPDKPNSRHRAELVKLMVHPDGRGQGVGKALLATAERAAVDVGVTLLHLDTETDSPAEYVYAKAGWTRIGAIPDYAADPYGSLRPTSIYYKRVGSAADGAVGAAAPAG